MTTVKEFVKRGNSRANEVMKASKIIESKFEFFEIQARCENILTEKESMRHDNENNGLAYLYEENYKLFNKI